MLKVNGKAYDWGDVDLKIPGLNIQVQEISYDDELEIEEVYGYGSKPRGYGTGNYKASGKLSIRTSSLRRSRSRETSSMTPSSAGACMTSSSPRTRS